MFVTECSYMERCTKNGTMSCKTCKNNHARNKKVDFYVKANDNPIPDKCPKLTFSGPAEQTLGYKCPVCGEYTDSYMMPKDKLCHGCGYELNVT